MSKEIMLTTYDNPFNPFTDFETWWKEDLILGHNCCGLLAKTSNVSDVSSDEMNKKYIIDAMNEIVSEEPLIYRIVTREDYEDSTD